MVLELENGLYGLINDTDTPPAEGDVVECWVDDGLRLTFGEQTVVRVVPNLFEDL